MLCRTLPNFLRHDGAVQGNCDTKMQLVADAPLEVVLHVADSWGDIGVADVTDTLIIDLLLTPIQFCRVCTFCCMQMGTHDPAAGAKPVSASYRHELDCEHLGMQGAYWQGPWAI